MKTLFLALVFLFSCGAKAGMPGVQTDKALHYGVSFAISEASYRYFDENDYRNPKLNAFLVAITVGVGKEMTDERFDNQDLMADLMGALTPIFLRYEF